MCLGMLRGMSGILTSIGLNCLCVFFFFYWETSECSCDCHRRKKSRGLIFLNWFCLRFKGFVS